MKTNLFFALLFVFVWQTIAAQQPLPPSLRAHAANWSHSQVKGLQHLGYQLPVQVAAMAGQTENRSGELVLDSTKTFYGYGVPFPTDSTPLFKSVYRYEPLNTRIEENEQFEAGLWLKMNRVTYVGDGLGRDVYIFAETYDPITETYVPDSRLEVFPHGNSGQLYDSVFTFQYNVETQEWYRLLAIYNTFDANNRILSSLSSLDLFGTPVWFKDVYTYDANGDNTLVESYFVLDGFELLSSKVESTYENHQPVETIAYIVDENGLEVPQSRVTRTFVLTDKEKQVDSYEWDATENQWIHTEQLSYDYDNQARVVIKEQTFFNQEAGVERQRFTYAYREGEYLAVESSYFWEGDEFILTDRKYYYYQGGTSAVRETPANLPLVVSPNPTVGQAQIMLDEPAVIKIYNTNGDLISSGAYQPNTTLLLFDLPQGLYFITARTEKEIYSGRIVKL